MTKGKTASEHFNVNLLIKFGLFLLSLVTVILFIAEVDSRDSLLSDIAVLERELDQQLVRTLQQNGSDKDTKKLISEKQRVLKQLKLHVQMLISHGESKGVMSKESITFFVTDVAKANSLDRIDDVVATLNEKEKKIKKDLLSQTIDKVPEEERVRNELNSKQARIARLERNIKALNEKGTEQRIASLSMKLKERVDKIGGDWESERVEISLPLDLASELFFFLRMVDDSIDPDDIHSMKYDDLKAMYLYIANYKVLINDLLVEEKQDEVQLSERLKRLEEPESKQNQEAANNNTNTPETDKSESDKGDTQNPYAVWLYLSSNILFGVILCQSSLLGTLLLLAREQDQVALRDVILGLSSGMVVFLATKAGPEVLMYFSNGNNINLNPFSCAFLALLAGMFSDRVYDVLSKIFRNIEDAMPSQKAANEDESHSQPKPAPQDSGS